MRAAECSLSLRPQLKGSSRTVGLEDFGKVVHAAENVIELIKSRKLAFDQNISGILLESQSFLIEWVKLSQS